MQVKVLANLRIVQGPEIPPISVLLTAGETLLLTVLKTHLILQIRPISREIYSMIRLQGNIISLKKSAILITALLPISPSRK